MTSLEKTTTRKAVNRVLKELFSWDDKNEQSENGTLRRRIDIFYY